MASRPDSEPAEVHLGVDGEAEWQRLRQQVELASGFWLAFVFVPSAAVANALFRRFSRLLRTQSRNVTRVLPAAPDQLVLALSSILAPDAPRNARWVEATQVDSPNQASEDRSWTAGWDELMLRANEKRDAFRRTLDAALVFVAHPSMKPRIREAAPDLWSVRSIVLEIAPVASRGPGVGKADLSDDAISRDVLPPSSDPDAALAEAHRRLERGSADKRSAVASLLRAATGFLESNRINDSIETARLAVDHAVDLTVGAMPDIVDALRILARAENAGSDPISAMEHLRLAIASARAQQDPRLAGLLYEHARLAVRTGDLKKAQEQATAALRHAAAAGTEDPESSQLLSSIYLLSGDIERRQGRLTVALEAYQHALAISERWSVELPSAAEWQDARARCLVRIGDVRNAQGDLARGIAAYEHARAMYERLAAADPLDSEWQRNLSISWSRIGDVRRAQGDLRSALQAYESDRAITERLAATEPANHVWQRDLSVTWDRIGDVRQAQGDLVGALHAYNDARAFRERLVAADPTNPQWQRDLSISWNNIGDILVDQGDLPGALSAYENDRAIAERLVAMDPANAEWQRDLSISLERVGNVRRAQADLAGALAAYEQARAIREGLASVDPTNAELQRDVSIIWSKIGDVRLAQDDLAGALRAYERDFAIAERLAATDPTNGEWQRDLAVSWNKIGEVRRMQGDLAGAARAHERALELMERAVGSATDNPKLEAVLSFARERLEAVRQELNQA